MNIRPPGWIVLLLLACWHPVALKAQLKLGANPASISKSSILELESSRQGLLLPRVPDTAVTTLAAAPDGTIIYFTPANSILVRKEGAWRQMTDASTPGWLLNGNTLAGTVTLGTVNNFALPFITNNQERMRIAANGAVGIGNAAPSTKLHITTGTANDGGLRMENLTSSSAITTGSAVGALGMDATGKVVRAQRPVIYSGGAGANGAAGGTATADAVTKVWIANVNNTATGTQTINFPTNVTFTNILSIQAIAVGGTGTADAPVVSITSNTLSSMVIRVLESSTVVLANEALTLHTNTGTRIYIRVEGN
ncbi:hypothetical protein [Chitinophaga sp. 22620]|uniref:hypothetical protein n=1 Tax=Chitinophaga sp. 22620 TaxID=3453952 RepID=UPI003F852017